MPLDALDASGCVSETSPRELLRESFGKGSSSVQCVHTLLNASFHHIMPGSQPVGEFN
jgi:hypothetical protein